MAVQDSTGAFTHQQNNSGEQIQAASSNISGQIGEARQVQMPVAPTTPTLTDVAGKYAGELVGTAEGFISDGLEWGMDLADGAIDTFTSTKDSLLERAYGGKVGGSDGVFVGMDINNLDTFKTALTTYINGANDILAGLNLDPSIEVTLKGTNIETSLHEFLQAEKTLLTTYINSLNLLSKELDTAAENYKQSDTSIGGDVSADAESIRSEASNITIA